jgi:hypothetical protein
MKKILAVLAVLAMATAAQAGTYAVNFDAQYQNGASTSVPFPDNNPFGPTGAVQANWNQVNLGHGNNGAPTSASWTITDSAGLNPIALNYSSNSGTIGDNGGNYVQSTDMASLYGGGIGGNEGHQWTLTTAAAPFAGQWQLYTYYGSAGSGFALGTNYSIATVTGPLNVTYGEGQQVRGFSMIPEPATMSMLVIGGIATLIRRRNRR